MSIEPLASQFNGARRWRLFFSGPLASGAFLTGPYAVSDSIGPSPISVEAAYAIASDPNAVELSVSADLCGGQIYTVTCTAVPGTGGGGSFTGTFQDRTPLQVAAPPNVEPAQADIDLVLYSRDLYWNGQDFSEDATGDLVTVAGSPNWVGAMGRRMSFGPLKWARRYGANAYQYVDAPDAYQRPLAGALLGQARQDNRTATASVDVVQAPGDPDGWIFEMELTGRDGLQVQTIQIPAPTSL